MASPTFLLTEILIRGRQTNSQVIVSGIRSRREKNKDAWLQVMVNAALCACGLNDNDDDVT